TGNPHRGDIQHHAQGSQPEVQIDQTRTSHFSTAVQTWDQVVQGTEGNHGNPAQRAGVHVTNGPVGVVRQRGHRTDSHHGTFKGRHTVEGQSHNHELQDRVSTQLVPGTRQSHDAVDHAAPRGSQQNQGESHAQGLSPVWQGGVQQVVRTCPHVRKAQSPEV